MHYAEGSLMPLAADEAGLRSRIPSRLPFFFKPVGRAIVKGANATLLDPQIGNHFMFLESELAKREWFAGPDFSAADIQMSFPLEAASARAPMVRQMPKLAAFLDRIHARPAYRRAVEKGGPYELVK